MTIGIIGDIDWSDPLTWLNPLGAAAGSLLGDDDEPKRPVNERGEVIPGAGSGAGGQVSSADQIQADAQQLRRLGYNAPKTGDAFNKQFMAAVRAFQQSAQRAGTYLDAVDGLTGPNTRAAIAAAVQKLPGAPSAPAIVDPTNPEAPPAAMADTGATKWLVGGIVALVAGGAIVMAMASPKRKKAAT